MRGELITVGDEVLDGRVLNTNARYLVGRLATIGLSVGRITTVGDSAHDIARALRSAINHSSFVVVTGGLGPTEDDITTAAVAEALDRPLILRSDLLDHIASVCQDRGWPVGMLEKLARLPQGAEPIDPKGLCSGFFIETDQAVIFFLPGVPTETRQLFDRQVLPLLRERFPDRPHFRQQTLKIIGLTESEVAERLQSLYERHPEVAIGSYPQLPEVHVSLTAKGLGDRRQVELLAGAEADLLKQFGEALFGRDDDSLESVLGDLLRQEGLSLATAESCTGGLVAERITSIPGASDYFFEGVVTYSNQAKEDLLGVDAELLKTHGAVSPQVALAMAEGLKHRSGVDLAVSITGIAGPDGGSAEKPVGTVFFGLKGLGRSVTERRLFRGDRNLIQRQAASHALDLCRRLVMSGSE